ncbi:hypothetical protein GQ600_26584 [Phytophthora cactorum]|nr:hypothetical protein GQ600_26584 [Phytophthora cactorum]
MEPRMGISECSAPAMAQKHPETTNSEDQCERHFEVRRSDKLANDPTGDLFCPHVSSSFFSFWAWPPRGAPRNEFFLRWLHLIDCHCAICTSRNHFRCQRFPTLYNQYESLATEQLGRALLKNEQRRQGRLLWRPQTDDDVATKFLKTVEIGTRSVWGSSGERSQCRHKAFAYQTRFASLHYLSLLTPNTDNSLVLAHYSGALSVETLFDFVGEHFLRNKRWG